MRRYPDCFVLSNGIQCQPDTDVRRTVVSRTRGHLTNRTHISGTNFISKSRVEDQGRKDDQFEDQLVSVPVLTTRPFYIIINTPLYLAMSHRRPLPDSLQR